MGLGCLPAPNIYTGDRRSGRENGGNSHDRNFKDRDLNDTAF